MRIKKFIICGIITILFSKYSVIYADSTPRASCVKPLSLVCGEKGGQCVNFARNYFFNLGFLDDQMPCLGSPGPAYLIYKNWNLGFGSGKTPDKNSLLVLDKLSSTDTTGHVAVVTQCSDNGDGTYSLIISESNWAPNAPYTDETVRCGVPYLFNLKTMTTTRNGGTHGYPVLGFVYGQSPIIADSFNVKETGDIYIYGSGFGNQEGSVKCSIKDPNAYLHLLQTVYPEAQYNSSTQYDFFARIDSWSDQGIEINIFNNTLNKTNFDGPITLTILDSNGKTIFELFFPFSDVPPADKNNWASPYIHRLWRDGIINGVGYTGGFNKSGLVSRAEFLKMVIGARIKKTGESLPSTPSSAPYADIPLSGPGAWQSIYTSFAKDHQLIQGALLSQDSADLSKVYFKPDQALLRWEAAALIVSVFGLNYQFASIRPEPYWWKNTIDKYYGINSLIVYQYGIMDGYNAMDFGSSGNLTRQEAAKIICLAMNAK